MVSFKILITPKRSSFGGFAIRGNLFILGCFTYGRSLRIKKHGELIPARPLHQESHKSVGLDDMQLRPPWVRTRGGHDGEVFGI